jgi:ubiquinone/menaquinone biosynthesis C-methylase UbiE
VDRNTADDLLRLITGGWLAQAIHVAAKLGLADLLKEESKTAEQLAAETNTNSDALFRLLRTLSSVGVFHIDDGERIGLTPMAECLQASKPGSLKGYAVLMGEPEVWRAWGETLHAVRTGSSGFAHAFGKPVFTYYSEHPEAGRIAAAGFTSRTAMENSAIVDAYDFSLFKTIVDVGGGQGTLLASILKRHSSVEGVLFDMPDVVEMARGRLTQEAVQSRCQFVPGNFFESVPGGGNLYMVKRILHDWDDKHSRQILANCRRDMPAQAKLIVLDAVVPTDNGPSFAKLQDLHMLVYAGGRERTEAEHRSLLESAGFYVLRVTPVLSDMSVIEARPQ